MKIEKICIVGAGAIGGFLGTRLALHTRARVSALARGETLYALRQHGWRMQTEQGLESAALADAAQDATELGAQDLVVIAVKGQSLPQVAPSIRALLHEKTMVLPAMNGVPWWFCAGLTEFENRAMQAVDPKGVVSQAISIEHVLGCVVHASTATTAPALVQHKMGQGLIVGEPTGEKSERSQAVCDLLRLAKFDVTHSEKIRFDIWYKLWGNLTMNPVSALTGATVDKIFADNELKNFCSAVMREAAQIGEKIGCPIAQSPEDRHAITQKLGAFKTSMLQDVEQHRAIELDAIVTVVREMAQRLHVPTPHLDALLGLTRVMAQTKGLYPI